MPRSACHQVFDPTSVSHVIWSGVWSALMPPMIAPASGGDIADTVGPVVLLSE